MRFDYTYGWYDQWWSSFLGVNGSGPLSLLGPTPHASHGSNETRLMTFEEWKEAHPHVPDQYTRRPAMIQDEQEEEEELEDSPRPDHYPMLPELDDEHVIKDGEDPPPIPDDEESRTIARTTLSYEAERHPDGELINYRRVVPPIAHDGEQERDRVDSETLVINDDETAISKQAKASEPTH